MSSQADQEAKQAAQAKPAQAEAQTPTQPAKLGNPGLVYLIGALVAGCFGAVIGYSFLGESLALLGIPDPGPPSIPDRVPDWVMIPETVISIDSSPAAS